MQLLPYACAVIRGKIFDERSTNKAEMRWLY
jgi:hypothetical protein